MEQILPLWLYWDIEKKKEQKRKEEQEKKY